MTPPPAWRAATVSLALGALLAPAAQTAFAVATPINSTPTRYAALTHPPRIIRMRFSEAIVRKSSELSLTDLTGRPVRVAPVETRDHDCLEVRIGTRLGAGVYMVHWTAVSALDGSKASGRYQFTVQ